MEVGLDEGDDVRARGRGGRCVCVCVCVENDCEYRFSGHYVEIIGDSIDLETLGEKKINGQD